MEIYEIQPLIADIYKRHKENWEQTRMICYIIAQTNSSKRLKPTELISFFWDNDAEAHKQDTSISNDDINRLREQAKQIYKEN